MSDTITFVQKGSESSPLIVMNSFGDEWKHVTEALDALDVQPYSLLAVTCSEWNKDLAPWKADAVFKGEPGFEGGADLYLKRIKAFCNIHCRLFNGGTFRALVTL